MYFGLPILTSDFDFAKYICDDAALYFDPWNIDNVVEKILFLKGNPRLQKQLQKKGGERVSSFFSDWDQIAAKAIKELELLVSGRVA